MGQWRQKGRRWRRKVLRVGVVALLLGLLGEGLGYLVYVRNPAYRARQLAAQARIHVGLRQPEAARRALESAAELTPHDPRLVARLAELDLRQGSREQAMATLRRGIERLPHDRRLRVELARFLVRGWQPEQALAELEPLLPDVLDLPPGRERGQALIVLGLAQAGAGRLDEAEESLRAATDGAGEDQRTRAQALLELARFQLRLRRLGQARQALEQAEQSGASARELELVRGELLTLSGQPGLAVERLRALYEQRQDPVAGRQLGELLIRARRLEEARRLAAELRAAQDESAAELLEAGIAAREGRLEDAAASYEALQAGSETPEPLLLAAAARRQAGDWAGAEAAYRLLLTRVPGLREAEVGLLELELVRGEDEAASRRALRLLDDPGARGRAICALCQLAASPGLEEDLLAEALRRLRGLPGGGDRASRVFTTLLELIVAPQATPALERKGEGDLAAALGTLAVGQSRSGELQEALELLDRLLQRAPRLAPARVVLASLYLALGRDDLAEREARAAWEGAPATGALSPAVRQAGRLLVQLAGRRKDDSAAEALLLELLGRDPQDVETLAALAARKEAAGDPAAAAELLERACQEPPDGLNDRARGQLWARLAWARVRSGDRDGARQAFAEARQAAPGQVLSHGEAALWLAEGRYDEAADALARAGEATGEQAFAAARAALRVTRDPTQARRALEPWARQAEEPTAAVLVRMSAALAAGSDQAAARSFVAWRLPAQVPEVVAERALALDSGARRPLGLACELFALRLLGWREAAAERGARLLRDWPDEPLWVWWALAGLEEVDPRRQRALEQLARAAPDDVPLALDLVRARGTLAGFVELAQRFPQDPRVLGELAQAYERFGRSDDARAAYERLLELGERSPPVLNNLAYLWRDDAARRAEALALAREAVARAPGQPAFLDTLGVLLLRDGQLDEAYRCLLSAVGLAPAAPGLKVHLAQCLLARGEPERARRQLDVALLHGAPFPERPGGERVLAELLERERQDGR